MRLLDTSTLTLHEFQGRAVPYYAILSHRWDSEEVSFRDLQSEKARGMAGFSKIQGCCARAASEGWQYVWIDSCCIEKSSSAELSEAINTMFRWYQNAQVCYAYLSDVPEGDGDPSAAGSAFRKSKWFTRGWTLQELLAPSRVVFCNQKWLEIGTKSSLYESITAVTGIKSLFRYEQSSIAQKMSWASRRETTREEDMAYCLLGLFGVSMPPLYGEGENAFRRLQLEILNKSDDESIFAWLETRPVRAGLLANSPAAFMESGDIHILKEPSRANRLSYTMTNKGLHIELFLIPTDHERQDRPKTVLAPLNCFRGDISRIVAIKLESGSEGRWYRRADQLFDWNWKSSTKGLKKFIYVPQLAEFRVPYWKQRFLIHTHSILAKGFQIQQQEPSRDTRGVWKKDLDGLGLILMPIMAHLNNGALLLENAESKEKFVLVLEADNHGNAGVNLIVPTGVLQLARVLKSFYNEQPADERGVRLDRVSRYLSSGLRVSAVMIKRAIEGEVVYVVDVTLSKQDPISLSPPHTELVHHHR